MRGMNASKSASLAWRSWTARTAMSTYPARRTISSSLSAHWVVLGHASGVSRRRLLHHWSHRSQERRSRTQRSACSSVTIEGSPTMVASRRASCMPVDHSATDSSWSRPAFLASDLSSGIVTPSSAAVPYRRAPSTASGRDILLISSTISLALAPAMTGSMAPHAVTAISACRRAIYVYPLLPSECDERCSAGRAFS